MNTISFDTLKFANKLKAAGIKPEHAEAEAEAIADIFEISGENLATKNDIKLLKSEIDVKFAETKAELIRWVVGIGFLQTTLIVGVVMKAAKLI